MNHTTRRTFLKSGACVAAAVAAGSVPRPLLASFGGHPEAIPPFDDPRIKQLVSTALDAMRGAGVAYGDVRLTHERRRDYDLQNVNDHEVMTVGVRALVNGYWGFASSPVWSPDEMARLARTAALRAKANALGKPRIVDLAPVATVSDGHWVTPIDTDPFDVPPVEVKDFLQGLFLGAMRIPYCYEDDTKVECHMFVQDKAFGSTIGSYFTQRVYRTSGSYNIVLVKDGQHTGAGATTLTAAGLGWEMFRDQPLIEQIRHSAERAIADLALPIKPVDVGRYNTVIDASSMTGLLAGTIGSASQIDRALGFEANAGGTSYLNEPLEMLGTFKVGSPLLNVTANRNDVGSAATVKWDDEGVAPEPFTLVKDGLLVDYHTNREGAGWLKEYYTKNGIPLRSHGCASAPAALDPALTHTANIVMTPDAKGGDFDSLVHDLDKGMAIGGSGVNMDFQQLNGLLYQGAAWEVKGGKRVARIPNVGVLFRSPELWKNLIALGGPQSVVRRGLEQSKGEPPQSMYNSISAVPAAFKELTIIDFLRKA